MVSQAKIGKPFALKATLSTFHNIVYWSSKSGRGLASYLRHYIIMHFSFVSGSGSLKFSDDLVK